MPDEPSSVTRAVPDRVNAFALLEERVAERTRQLSTLLDISRALASTLELQPLLELVLDCVRDIVPYTEALIMLLDGDELCVAAYRGRSSQRALNLRVPAREAVVFQTVLRERRAVILDDIMGQSALAHGYRTEPMRHHDTRPPAIRSVLSVPLIVKDRLIGQLRLDHAQPGFYEQCHADMAAAVANQAAVAIEHARLFEDGERRRTELQALYQAEEGLHRSLEPHAVLVALLASATALLRADKAAVLMWDARREQLHVQAARGFETATLSHMSFAPGEAIGTLAAQTGEIVDTEDAEHDARISPRVRAIHVTERVRSLISVPIRVSGEVLGVFNVYSTQSRWYSPEDRRLLLALAQRAAVAVENARLFESERLVRERLELAVAAGQMGTWEWDIRTNVVTWSPQLEAIHGLAPGTFPGTFEAYLSDIHPEDRERVQRAISTSLVDGDHHLEYRIVCPDGSVRWLEANGRVTRDGDGQPLGMLGVCRDVTARKHHEAERARLLQREKAMSEARAALEERQRLARELHDSVSQALYGIALGSQTALGALREDRDADAACEATEYVLKLAEAAIAEMRALIFELRPESLEQEGLVGALERHAASLQARHALHVSATFDAEPELALDVKEALYRVAQEATHNAVKHAHASSIRMRISRTGQAVVLEVEDDGVGFDPQRAYPGHLGLTSMRERAAAVHAQLTIDSAAGQGTRVRVRVPTAH